MSNKALISKLREDLLIPNGKLIEKIDSISVDWGSLSSNEEALSKVIEAHKDAISEPVSSGVVMKNKDKALDLKKTGNDFFKAGKLMEAREAYTQALRYTPVNDKDPSDNKEYAIILANRSATSEGLGIHEGVVQDVDLALKYGYPREMHYKVLNRKAQAYKKLRQFFSSKQTYKKCQDMIGKSDMPTKMRDQWRTRTQKQINLFGIKKDAQPAKEIDHPFDNLTEGPSQQAQEMSSKLSVEEDKIICQEAVDTEDRLLLEPPLVRILSDPKSYGKLCPFTLKKMPAPIPCNYGSAEYFYDEEIRSMAWAAFHKYEWSILKELKENLSPLGHLSMRLILTHPLKIIQEISKKENNKISKEEAFYCGLVGVYVQKALLKVKFPETPSVLDCARLVLFTLKNRVPIFMLLKGDNEDRKQLLEAPDHPRQNYGLGIYPQYSNMMGKSKASHSNDVITHFLGSKLLLVANRRIPKGESISFKGMANLSGMNDVVLFKCEGSPQCGLSFPLKETTTEQVVICPLEDCGVDTNIWKYLKRLHELKREVKVGKEIFLGTAKLEKLREVLSKYEDVIEELETFIERPYKFITDMEREMRMFIEMDMAGREENWLTRSDTEFKNDIFA